MSGTSLSEYAAEASPRERPLTYPGLWPATSFLLTADAEWEIGGREERAPAVPGEEADFIRLGHCRVSVPAAERSALRLPTGLNPFLSDVLERLNVVPLDFRIPILAIGSNASPAQMRHKFRERGVSEVIPMMRATVTGIQAGYAPVVAPAGYVPATLVPAPDAVTTLFIQWLDEYQLRVVDDSELGYKRVYLPAGDPARPIRARLDTGEALGGMYAYIFESGVLLDSSGPVLMQSQLDGVPGSSLVPGFSAQGSAGASDPSPEAPSQTVYSSQGDLLEALLRSSTELEDEMGYSDESWVERASDPVRRHAVARILAEQGRIGGREFVADCRDERQGRVRRYGEILPILDVPLTEVGASVAVLTRSSERDVERNGQSCVRITSEMHARLGFPDHVDVRSHSLHRLHGSSAPAAVAAVIADLPVAEDDPLGSAPTAEVDHVLRMAVGLEIGEVARLQPVKVCRSRWPDLFVGRPNYETMRVTLADPSTTERDVCLLSALSLQLLGVRNGDHIVLEGIAGPDGAVPSTTLKAFELPSEISVERREATSGAWGSRFPSPRDNLGTQPDIAVIFLDAATRSRLGVTSQQMATVRARPARGHQFRGELREMMLILAIALIGVVGLVDNASLALLLILGFVGGSLLLVVMRMKRRLSHTLSFTTGLRWKAKRSRTADAG